MQPIPGPFVVIVCPEHAVTVQRPASEDGSPRLPLAVPVTPPAVPFVAIATCETADHHAQLNASYWAMTDEDRLALAGRLRDLAALLESRGTPALPKTAPQATIGGPVTPGP